MELGAILALAIAGIAAIPGAVLVYDRFFLKRPVLDFVATAPDIFLGVPATVFLKIRNRADTDILVTGIDPTNRNVIVGFNETVVSVLMLDGGLPFEPAVVRAGAEELFHIYWLDRDPGDKGFVRFTVRWRRINGWLNGFPIWRRLDRAEFDSLAADADRRRRAK